MSDACRTICGQFTSLSVWPSACFLLKLGWIVVVLLQSYGIEIVREKAGRLIKYTSHAGYPIPFRHDSNQNQTLNLMLIQQMTKSSVVPFSQAKKTPPPISRYHCPDNAVFPPSMPHNIFLKDKKITRRIEGRTSFRPRGSDNADVIFLRRDTVHAPFAVPFLAPPPHHHGQSNNQSQSAVADASFASRRVRAHRREPRETWPQISQIRSPNF